MAASRSGSPASPARRFDFHNHPPAITVPDRPSLNPGGSGFWMSARIKFSTVPTAADGDDYDLIRKGLSATSGGFSKMEALPSPGFTRPVQAHCSMKGSITSHSVTAGPDLADGQWHTIQCLKESGALSVIIDGAKTTDAVTLGSFSDGAVVAVGGKELGGDFYDGVMDELQLRDRGPPLARQHRGARDQRRAGRRPDALGEHRELERHHAAELRLPVAALHRRGHRLQRHRRRDPGHAHAGAGRPGRDVPRGGHGGQRRRQRHGALGGQRRRRNGRAGGRASGRRPRAAARRRWRRRPGRRVRDPSICNPLTADATSRKLKLGGASAITLG